MQRLCLPLIVLLLSAGLPRLAAQTTAPAPGAIHAEVADDPGTVLWQFDTGG